MSKFVNAVVLGLVSFVLILAVFWYVVEIRQDSQVAITDVTAGWGASNSRTTEIKVKLAVFNPHKSPVELRDITYEVIVNGDQLTTGVANKTVIVGPEEAGTQEFTAIVPTRFIVDWIDSHLENDERTNMKIKGEAKFAISTLLTVTPFEWESSWEGRYVQGLEAVLSNCPSRESEPCIASTKAAWNTNGTQSVMDTTYKLRNPNGHALRIKSWSVDFLLENITVARGGTGTTINLDANGEATLMSPVTFDRLPMPTWFPEHVKHCERSRSTIVIKFLVEEDRPSDGGTAETLVTSITWQFAGPPFDTHFFCDPA